MNYKNKTGSTASVIILILAIMAVAFGALYLFSPWVRTKVNQLWVRDLTWSPERIQKDPVGYLTHALAEVQKARDQMEANYISLSKNQREYARLKEQLLLEQQAAKKLLENGKTAYRDATQANAWPATFERRKVSEADLKSFILKTARLEASKGKMAEKYGELLLTLESCIKRTKSKLDETETARDEVNTNLEYAKANSSINNIGQLLKTVNTAVDISDILTENSKGLDPKALIETGGITAAETSQWEKIMGK